MADKAKVKSLLLVFTDEQRGKETSRMFHSGVSQTSVLRWPGCDLNMARKGKEASFVFRTDVTVGGEGFALGGMVCD